MEDEPIEAPHSSSLHNACHLCTQVGCTDMSSVVLPTSTVPQERNTGDPDFSATARMSILDYQKMISIIRHEIKAEMQCWKAQMERDFHNSTQDVQSNQTTPATPTTPAMLREEIDRWKNSVENKLESYARDLLMDVYEDHPSVARNWDSIAAKHKARPTQLELSSTKDSSICSAGECSTQSTPESAVMRAVANVRFSASKALKDYASHIDKLDDLHRRVIVAFRVSDTKGSSNVVIPGLRYGYLCVLFIIYLSLWTFAVWGMVKIFAPRTYFEIHKEEFAWLSGEMPLPNVAYDIKGTAEDDFDVRVAQCVIRNGVYSTKECTSYATHPCKMQAGGSDGSVFLNMCLNSNLRVQGTWGSPSYKYVQISLSPRNNATVSESATISLTWVQRLTLYNNITLERLYSTSKPAIYNAAPVHEIFFRRVVAREGTWLGFAGHHGNDESEDLLHSNIYLKQAYEYTRLKTGSSSVAIVLRADPVEIEEFYECYSLLRLLQTTGGLWTSLFSLLAGSTLFLVRAYLKCKDMGARRERLCY